VKWCTHFSLHVRGPIRAAMEFAKLVPRCDKCVNLLRDYVEKQWHLVEHIIYANFVITLICMSYGTLSIEHINQQPSPPTPPTHCQNISQYVKNSSCWSAHIHLLQPISRLTAPLATRIHTKGETKATLKWRLFLGSTGQVVWVPTCTLWLIHNRVNKSVLNINGWSKPINLYY